MLLSLNLAASLYNFWLLLNNMNKMEEIDSLSIQKLMCDIVFVIINSIIVTCSYGRKEEGKKDPLLVVCNWWLFCQSVSWDLWPLLYEKYWFRCRLHGSFQFYIVEH